MAFTRTLNQEDQRHISEQLSEEELAMFDLLTRPNTVLSEQEKTEVKKVARSLLETLKREKAGARLAQEAAGESRRTGHHRSDAG